MDISYTVIKQLLLPPGIALLLLALAFLLVRGTLGRLLLFVTWSVLLIMSLPGLAYPLIGLLEQEPALDPAALDTHGAGAIVVLGGDVYSRAPEFGADTVGPLSLQRVRYAAWLHRHTGLPIYVTGGVAAHPVGPLMQQVLTGEFGVPVARVEDQSRTTWENAEFTAPLLAADGIKRVLLVTQAWHMSRAVAAFERAGVAVLPAPTAFVHRPPNDNGNKLADWLPQANAFAASSYAVHEVLGGAYYRLREQLGAPTGAPAPTH